MIYLFIIFRLVKAVFSVTAFLELLPAATWTGAFLPIFFVICYPAEIFTRILDFINCEFILKAFLRTIQAAE